MNQIKTLTKSQFAKKIGVTPDLVGKYINENPGALKMASKPNALVIDCPENFEAVKGIGKKVRGIKKGQMAPKTWFAKVDGKDEVLNQFAKQSGIDKYEVMIWLTAPKESTLDESQRKTLKRIYKQTNK